MHVTTLSSGQSRFKKSENGRHWRLRELNNYFMIKVSKKNESASRIWMNRKAKKREKEIWLIRQLNDLPCTLINDDKVFSQSLYHRYFIHGVLLRIKMSFFRFAFDSAKYFFLLNMFHSFFPFCGFLRRQFSLILLG